MGFLSNRAMDQEQPPYQDRREQVIGTRSDFPAWWVAQTMKIEPSCGMGSVQLRKAASLL